MRLQVSTHTLSPISRGFTDTTSTSSRDTVSLTVRRSLNLEMESGSSVWMTTPSTPFSMVFR